MLSLKSMGSACALGASFLLGCTTHSADLSTAAPSTGTRPSLQSHHWQLQSALNAQGAADTQWQLPSTDSSPARIVGLRFSEGQGVSVDRLCNLVHGGYATQGQQIHISRVASTMMACADNALMQLEKNVAQQLPQARTWDITGTANPVLALQFADGSTWRFTGTPTHETLYGRSERIFLEIAPQKVACNSALMPGGQCLQAREVQYSEQGIKQSVGPWFTYHGAIDGYQHHPSVRNVLRIKRFTRNPAPAGASKYVDVLDLAVESEIVR